MRRLAINAILLLSLLSPVRGAIRCDSATDAFSATTNLPAAGGYTMAGWFKIITDRNAATAFLDYGANSTVDKTLETDSDGTTLLLWDGATFVTGTNLVVGQWYHLAITWDGTTALAYLDGALNITNPGTLNPTTTIRVGNDAGSEFLNGRFSCVKVWSAVLTAAEIANEAKHCRPLRTNNLNRWVPTIHNVLAADALDKSGNAFNYTVTSTPIVEADYPPVGW